ncbi:para-aminobenzoate synthase, subunit I [Kribbella flavida DSM 17836]|uniref:aminodeoxychorismate synthase n=1 Tax=Kribbella flavida (strain DSM 17836 / JCM 10339 / NBRC 14399) TaxID=479435 RepID=D2PSP3_KRIFD|nr:aminodeoxychorismate synthase component I [Kribbella flavida]ADB33181.1 para-aminobenzoate synthase, subunit I [Kribbella flavida DSM 17836]
MGMRLLLIDNYDSYTYNLFQLLAAATGQEPTVLVNDDPRLSRLDPAAYDAVVISPGPGRPQHATDLGWSWEVLQRFPQLPILGVCLGHQTIAYQAGAEVREGDPRHGHITQITHDGTGLFAGFPEVFDAVRYHSLHVTGLPDEVEATAWSEDGVIMALRHRTLPRWGVQFHPESVATELGLQLVQNFLDLVAANGRRALRLETARLGHTADTEQVFRALYADSTNAFWLDSSLAEAGRARFSFLGDCSGPLSEVLTYRTGDGEVEVRAAAGVRSEPGTIFDVLERRLAQRALPAAELPFQLNGGYVGYFGYELKAETGGTNAHRSRTPDAAWMFADRLVVVDHQESMTYLVAITEDEDSAARAGRDWLTATARALGHLPAAGRLPASVRANEPSGEGLDRTRERYLADIAACQDELRRGESYEICLTNHFSFPPLTDPLGFYLDLRHVNPAPYAAYLRFGDLTVMSSSPERFLKITADGLVESKPIKGTAPRSSDPGEDEELRNGLTRSAKTRAENLMIVDLVRNDLGRVCEIGSVEVPQYLVTESYATVHQLVSTIRGQLRPEVGPVTCVRACFPGGSMTGAPKVRTMEIIDRLEEAPRGVYSGALGYLGLGGGADLSIVIRTAVNDGQELRIGAGGAIVLGSDPEDEYDEMMLKARALLATRVAQVGAGDLTSTTTS